MTQAIGTYRSCLGYWGEELGVVYWPTPIFGVREVGLPLVKRDFTQVLIESIGGLAWINVEPSDFTLQHPMQEDTVPHHSEEHL